MNITKHKPSRSPDKETSAREVLPVLIPCGKGEASDGFANFLLISEGKVSRSGGPVRLFRNRDIHDEAIKKNLSAKDQELLKATLALKGARERNDPVMPMDAYMKLLVHLGYEEGDKELAKVFTYPGWADVHIPRLATDAMAGASLVLWYSRVKKFIPAVYCRDYRTAIFARAFLGFQACPHCGNVFLPTKENMVYCSPKHGHAHRMARMRRKHGQR